MGLQTSQYVMDWNDFDGLHQMLSLRIGRFPLSGLLAKKDDIAPLVRSQLPTCFAKPKNAGRLFGSRIIFDQRFSAG